MNKITPCLWFDGQADDAAKFYTSIFKNSRVGRIVRFGEEGREIHGGRPGTVMTVEFSLDGQKFTALNGGPAFKFTEAVSFQVRCKTQEEVDYYWNKLAKGGDKKARQCGWLKDKYGVSWQIDHVAVPGMLNDKNPEKAGRVMRALLKMKKLNIRTLERAYKKNSKR